MLLATWWSWERIEIAESVTFWCFLWSGGAGTASESGDVRLFDAFYDLVGAGKASKLREVWPFDAFYDLVGLEKHQNCGKYGLLMLFMTWWGWKSIKIAGSMTFWCFRRLGGVGKASKLREVWPFDAFYDPVGLREHRNCGKYGFLMLFSIGWGRESIKIAGSVAFRCL